VNLPQGLADRLDQRIVGSAQKLSVATLHKTRWHFRVRFFFSGDAPPAFSGAKPEIVKIAALTRCAKPVARKPKFARPMLACSIVPEFPLEEFIHCP